MEKMKRLLSKGLGAIGMGSTGSESNSVHLEQDYPTRLSSGLTYQSLEKWEICVIGLLTLLVGFCLLVEILIGTGVIVAQPVSQGGIDYQDGGFSAGQGGFPMVGDLAELAARLGSPVFYDRRGAIVYATTFEYGLQGLTFGTDSAESVGSITAATSYLSPYSVKFDPSDDSGSYVEMGRVLQFYSTGKIGIEMVFSFDSHPYEIVFSALYYTGSELLRGQVLYRAATGEWEVRDNTLGWTTIYDDYELQAGKATWHHVKWVIDTDSEEYVRLMVDNTELDLSDYSLVSASSSSLGQLVWRFSTFGEPATHAAAYLAAVIVTQNES